MNEQRRVVAQRLRERRKALGLSQAELAAKVSVSPAYVSMIESGSRENVGSSVLTKIAAALDTTADYLLGLTDDPRPPSQEPPPIPQDLEPLIQRLARLDPEERRKVVDGFTHMLDVMESIAEAEEEDLEPDEQEFLRLFDQLPPEEQERFRRLLEEEVGREQGRSAVA